MGNLVLVLLVMCPVVVFLAVGRNQMHRSRARSATVELEIGPLGVRRTLADGREERVDWDELTEVEVLTAKGGPYGDAGGVVILAGDEEHGCLVPLDRLPDTDLLAQLGRLPGFDVAVLVAAMQRPPGTRSSCWTLDTPPDRSTS